MTSTDDFKFYVIGAGLPRTGTLSTKTALEILLPGRCMHTLPASFDLKKMSDVEDYIESPEYFFDNEISDEKFKKNIIKLNIVAGVDMPFILKYRQAMRIFPDALVLLTVRDPESWVTSMKNTICKWEGKLFKTFPTFLFLWVRPVVDRSVKLTDNNKLFREMTSSVNNGKGVKFFNNYVDEIKATVPPERLLVFNVKDGWKPLCDALNLPIPDVDFPRVNDTSSMDFKVRFITLMSWGIFIAGVTIPILVGYGIKRNVENGNLYNIMDGTKNLIDIVYQQFKL